MDPATGEIIATVTSDAQGKALFTLVYTEDHIGTHSYLLVEADTQVKGVTYSKAQYLIDITVSLSQDNRLIATVSSGETTYDAFVAEFVNIYEEDVIPPTGDRLLAVLCTMIFGLAGLVALPLTKKKMKI